MPDLWFNNISRWLNKFRERKALKLNLIKYMKKWGSKSMLEIIVSAAMRELALLRTLVPIMVRCLQRRSIELELASTFRMIRTHFKALKTIWFNRRNSDKTISPKRNQMNSLGPRSSLPTIWLSLRTFRSKTTSTWIRMKWRLSRRGKSLIICWTLTDSNQTSTQKPQGKMSKILSAV